MSNFASGYIKYVNRLEQINNAAINNPEKMIMEVEDSYREHLENIARNLSSHYTNFKVCMLAGPSSSGKTTTALLLQGYLKKFGKNSIIVSMDNYYLGRDKAPKLPDGMNDFESVGALDIEKIQTCLDNIVNNRTISIPRYSFNKGTSVGKDEQYKIKPDDLVIMEGLHGLNPIFTAKLPADKVLRLYVSVKQQIKDANGEVISPFDLRLVRRIVRDIRFRNTPPEKTLLMWDNVVKGEDKYIRPYRLSADYTVNSIHIYEPCVLRVIAIPLLREIPEDSECYKKARLLESKLMRFEQIDPNLVPKESMLREFIGPKYIKNDCKLQQKG
jgi:uridine kinase